MSIRGIWILSVPGKTGGKVVFSRFFPTVERRAKLIDADEHVAIPDNQELVDAVFIELGLKNKSDKFVESRDSCRKLDRKPVYEVSTHAGKLWPMLAIEQYGLIFCCLPAVERKNGVKDVLIEIPGVSVGYNLLATLIDFLGFCPSIDENHPKLADLHLFLSQAMPFGTPVDLSLRSVDTILTNKIPLLTTNQKQPAWKPVLHRGKGVLSFTIKETMRAVQYDSPNIADVYDVYGSVTSSCNIEGMSTDVTLILTSHQDSFHIPFDDLMVNPCVQNCDVQTLSKGAMISPLLKSQTVGPHKMRFNPPLETITLCHYTAKPVTEPPIKGFFQMKGETTVELLVQLKLNEKVKNSFEYCELQMPFYHRGQAIDHDASTNHGLCLLSPDRRVLVWNIGQKFPSRGQEILLKATVRFKEYAVEENGVNLDEQFCIGQNSYAQLFFKIEDYTLSGCWIDPKSVAVSPNTKYKIAMTREFVCSDYRIWNSHGDAQTALPPPRYLTR